MKDSIINKTGVWNGDYYHHIGIHSATAAIYGDKVEDIEEISFKVSNDQEIREFDKNDKTPDYWGWYDKIDQEFSNMIYPQRFLLNMCFPSGIEASEDAGQGKAYRLEIINK